MVKIRPFKSFADLTKRFVLQKAQTGEVDFSIFNQENLSAFTMESENETLAIFWFWDLGGGRVNVGSLISQYAGPYFREMQRLIERLFKFYNAPRYEALVKTDFENGHRMIKILGFEREGTMKKFLNGIDYDLYSRCK